ncbi:S9 family peptidase [Virgibacillus kimchii]
MITFSKPIVEQFFHTYKIIDFAVSKDEKRLIFSSNLNGKMNLWAMDLPDNFPYLFSHLDEFCHSISIDPQYRFVLAGFDKDGDENFQIYAIPYEGGLPQPFITGAASEKYFLSHLSEDGKRVYYITSENNPNYLNTHLYNLENASDTLINTGEVSPAELKAVSDDEKAFAYVRHFANTYVTGFVKTGEETYPLVPDPDKEHFVANPVFTDNNTVYFLTDYESEYNYIAKYDLIKKEFSPVKAIEGESATGLKWHKEQNIFYVITEKGVKDVLYRYDLATNDITQIEMPTDIISKLHVAESGTLFLLGEGDTVPQNIFQSEDGISWRQLTTNRVLGIDREGMVSAETVSYSSFDGLNMEALLFKPKPENDNGHTIFWPHGGPQAAERKTYRSMFQCFLHRGYTIFAPNFRGSTGYGSSFVKMVNRDWGGGPAKDCMAGVNWLFENNITDSDRLFLVGGSYGGYMALLLHGRYPEYFKAVVDIFGTSSLFTFLESAPEQWKPLLDRAVGDPERDKEKLTRDSPITYLDSMIKPMLVIQGEHDPRVVKKHSDQVVEKLKEKGREVEYHVLEDEGHGFSKKENEMKVYSWMLDFLEKHQK